MNEYPTMRESLLVLWRMLPYYALSLLLIALIGWAMMLWIRLGETDDRN